MKDDIRWVGENFRDNLLEVYNKDMEKEGMRNTYDNPTVTANSAF